ncbi:hypothetical protein TNCV_1584011 [Trichonephila clavipes]|nr:hypothetical protein TNCV_1584011 [Trichonephila clavipes]
MNPSNADAFSALETAMESYEQQSAVLPNYCCSRESDIAAKNEGAQCVQFHILYGSRSVIRTIAYPNGVRSLLIRMNNVLLYIGNFGAKNILQVEFYGKRKWDSSTFGEWETYDYEIPECLLMIISMVKRINPREALGDF